MEDQEVFYVKCNMCEAVLKDWIGSTPCCGSIAYECDKDGKVDEKMRVHLYVSTRHEEEAPQ
jgi:hypothetical protein